MNELFIVLGVNGALGKSIAKSALESNNKVIGLDIHDFSSLSNVIYHKCDFKVTQNVIDSLSDISLPPIYSKLLLVSCLGSFSEPTFDENMDFDYIDLIDKININLVNISVFICGMIKKIQKININKFTLVVISSTSAIVGSQDVGYGISKAGLIGLVKSLSKILSLNGALIVGICPGIFISPMSQSVSLDRQNDAINSTHIKRAGTVDEITNLINYLLNNAPKYLTGSIININGGQA